MKKIKSIVLAVFLIICLSSCFSGFFAETEEEIISINIQHTTEIEFRNDFNMNNVHAVNVYLTPDRSDTPTVINAFSISNPVSVEPVNDFYYYFTYVLRIEGISINYVLPPKYGTGMGVAHVPRNSLTSAYIPSILDRMNEYHLSHEINDPLVTDTYFSVFNNTTGAINFVVLDQAQPFHNGTTSVPQNAGATNTYRLSQNQFSSINNTTTGVRSIGTYQTTPLNTTGETFQRGYFYNLEFSSSGITIISSRPINIANTQ